MCKFFFTLAYIKDILYLCTLKKIFYPMMDLIIVAILVLVGVLLLVAEMFFLPGIGFAGVGGAGCCAGAVAWAYLKISTQAGTITLLVCAALAIVLAIIFFRSRAIEKMGLDTEIDSTVTMPEAGKHMEEMKK